MAKHNKKRNTAFIFEALSHEMTKAIVSKDEGKKAAVVSIVRKHFKKGTQLRKELDLFQSLSESSEPQRERATRIVQEARTQHSNIDRDALFLEQTALINAINKTLSKNVFSNFVGNYKHLATISKMFSDEVSVKERMLLEDTVISTIAKESEISTMKPVDEVVYKTFVQKFNEEYSSVLPQEQKELLKRYISSISDNGVEFKMYLNEEVGRLKNKVQESLQNEEISSDKEMTESTTKVIKVLNEMANKPIDEELIRQVMNVQSFVTEVES
jgi:hypothetical protein